MSQPDLWHTAEEQRNLKKAEKKTSQETSDTKRDELQMKPTTKTVIVKITINLSLWQDAHTEELESKTQNTGYRVNKIAKAVKEKDPPISNLEDLIADNGMQKTKLEDPENQGQYEIIRIIDLPVATEEKNRIFFFQSW